MRKAGPPSKWTHTSVKAPGGGGRGGQGRRAGTWGQSPILRTLHVTRAIFAHVGQLFHLLNRDTREFRVQTELVLTVPSADKRPMQA